LQTFRSVCQKQSRFGPGEDPDSFAMHEDAQKKTEYRYRVFEWVLIFVNLLMAALYGVAYWLLVTRGEAFVRLVNLTMGTHFAVLFMSFVSACFFGRRAKKNLQNFQAGEKLAPQRKSDDATLRVFLRVPCIDGLPNHHDRSVLPLARHD